MDMIARSDLWDAVYDLCDTADPRDHFSPLETMLREAQDIINMGGVGKYDRVADLVTSTLWCSVEASDDA